MNNKTDSDLIQQTITTIQKNGLLSRKDSVLVCVSGGPDSVAMLNILRSIESDLGFRIGICHLNHKLRGEESDRDAVFVKQLAAAAGIRYHSAEKDVNRFRQENRLSIEDAARKVRYRFFSETAEKYQYTRIATAHTANDNAELVLMNLLRGSGTSGLSGIPVKRGMIIRPLIEATREAVMAYVADRGLAFVEDSSNADRQFLRNRVRLDMLPMIKRDYNENIIDALNRTSRILREEEVWSESIIRPIYKKSVIRSTPDSVELSATALSRSLPAEKRRVVRMAIASLKGDLKKITEHHTDLAARLLTETGPAQAYDLPDRIRVERRKDRLLFTRHPVSLREVSVEPQTYCQTVTGSDLHNREILLPEIDGKMRFRIIEPEENIPLDKSNKTIALLDLDKLEFPLSIQSPKPQDRFTPLGMTGSQSLTKFFSGAGLTRMERANVPVLYSGNTIAWVGGHRISHRFRLRKETKKILKVELFLE